MADANWREKFRRASATAGNDLLAPQHQGQDVSQPTTTGLTRANVPGDLKAAIQAKHEQKIAEAAEFEKNYRETHNHG